MSFGQVPTVDLRVEYRNIAQQFTQFYYPTLDQNLQSVAGCYFSDTYFTILGEEACGFPQYLQRLGTLGVQRFHHRLQDIDAQPINENSLLVQVTGVVTADGTHYNKFVESFVLLREAYSNNFHVRNQVLRLVP